MLGLRNIPVDLVLKYEYSLLLFVISLKLSTKDLIHSHRCLCQDSTQQFLKFARVTSSWSPICADLALTASLGRQSDHE